MMQYFVKPTVFVVVVLAVAVWGVFEVVKRGMAAVFDVMMDGDK